MIINNIEYKKCPINSNYYISKYGDIYSKFSNRNIKWKLDHLGYPRIDMYVDGKQKHFKVHRLVWITWKGYIPEGLQLNHKDDDKLHPYLDNLYLGTQKDNMQDKVRRGRCISGVYTLKIHDKYTGEDLVFCPAFKFFEYDRDHKQANGGVSRCFNRLWFKKRYIVIYYRRIENLTTKADECKLVK